MNELKQYSSTPDAWNLHFQNGRWTRITTSGKAENLYCAFYKSKRKEIGQVVILAKICKEQLKILYIISNQFQT